MRRSFLVLCALVIVGCSSANNQVAEPQQTLPPSDMERACPGVSSFYVEYKVEGGASSAHVTMSTADGGTSQQDYTVPMALPNHQAVHFCAAPGAHLYVSAQNASSFASTIDCAITKDGAEVSRNRSNGLYVIVTCNTSA